MSLYTKEELAAAREAKKAERAREKELLKGKNKEEKAEIKRRLAKAKLAHDTANKVAKLNNENLKALQDMIKQFAGDAIEKRAKELADRKAKDFVAKIKKVKNGKHLNGRTEISFTIPQLIRTFDGWFTLQYLFSMKTGVTDDNGKEIDSDFYVCSKDCTLMKESERPKRNDAIFNAFGVEVYGYCIIAPASAF